MSLDEELAGVQTLLHFAGASGQGWYARMEGQANFGFGKTPSEALAQAKLPKTPRRRPVIDEQPQPTRRRTALFD